MKRAIWHVEFYFDFLSPYAYLSWIHARPRCAGIGVHLEPRPVLLSALLGQRLGPAEVPAKRDYILRDTMRYARRHGITYQVPDPHPFYPVTALRLALPEIAGDNQERVIDALFHAAWGQGKNVGDDQVLTQTLSDAGLPGQEMVAATREQTVKDALRGQTEAAVARGIFGVPSFSVEDQLFWGHDRVDDLCEYIAGDDPLANEADQAQLRTFLARPVGLTRNRA